MLCMNWPRRRLRLLRIVKREKVNAKTRTRTFQCTWFGSGNFLAHWGEQAEVVRTANSALTLLFWQVGKRVNDEVLKNDRAQYGKQIVANVSAQLEMKYGRNFAEKNLRRMMQFSIEFPDFQIVVPLARQLTWSHFLLLIPIKSIDSKLYYAQHASENN